MYNFENDLMCEFENKVISRGFHKIGGIDEAGRGALAGPVVAACVILDPSIIPAGIDDSKRLSDKRRRELFKLIRETAVSIGIGSVVPGIIDRVNIYNATKMAMKSAILNMEVIPDFLLIDAVKVYDISISSLSIIKGDQKSVSIAAASIIAKVFRDDVMIQYSEKYPEYGFSSHKGYATLLHRNALLNYGPTALHRISFKPVQRAYELWKLKKQR